MKSDECRYRAQELLKLLEVFLRNASDVPKGLYEKRNFLRELLNKNNIYSEDIVKYIKLQNLMHYMFRKAKLEVDLGI